MFLLDVRYSNKIKQIFEMEIYFNSSRAQIISFVFVFLYKNDAIFNTAYVSIWFLQWTIVFTLKNKWKIRIKFCVWSSKKRNNENENVLRIKKTVFFVCLMDKIS